MKWISTKLQMKSLFFVADIVVFAMYMLNKNRITSYKQLLMVERIL